MIYLTFPFPAPKRREMWQQVTDLIRAGGIVIYPTETLYAIGGNALDERVGQKLSQIKLRPADKPFPCLGGSLAALEKLSGDWPPRGQKLAATYWPGPLTMILNGHFDLPGAVRAPDGGVAMRWSSHPFITELAQLLPLPLISTSANLSGKAPALVAAELDEELIRQSDLIIVNDPLEPDSRPSTIIDIRYQPPQILRKGKVDLDIL